MLLNYLLVNFLVYKLCSCFFVFVGRGEDLLFLMSLQREPSFLKRKSHTILILMEVLEQLF